MPAGEAAARETAGQSSAVDWSQWSVILLKPDCLARGLTGDILAWISNIVQIVATRTVTVTEEQIFAHYADMLPLSEKLGFDVAAELRRIYLGRRVLIALAHGPNAPARLRALIGPTDPARAGPNTIRGRYGIDTLAAGAAERRFIDNLIHTSDDPEACRRDVAIWFAPNHAGLLTPSPSDEGARDDQRNPIPGPARRHR